MTLSTCFSAYPAALITRWRIIGLVLTLLAMSACQSSQQSHQHHRANLAADRDPPRARALNERAIEHIEQNDYETAEKLLRQALVADLMFGPAHNNLGRIYFEQDRFYEAAWEFEYAIQLMPNQPEPRNNLALVLERAYQLDEAITYYREALDMEPDNAEILGNLLRSRLQRGDRDSKLRQQLHELVLKDDRPRWVQWAREQLALWGHN